MHVGVENGSKRTMGVRSKTMDMESMSTVKEILCTKECSEEDGKKKLEKDAARLSFSKFTRNRIRSYEIKLLCRCMHGNVYRVVTSAVQGSGTLMEYAQQSRKR